MNVFFVLLLILALAFAGYRLTFRALSTPIAAWRPLLTGTEFLLLGVVLGPRLLGIVDPATLRGLAPLSAFLLGWLGMRVGFHFDFRQLGRQKPGMILTALILAALTFAIVALGTDLWIVPLLAPDDALRWPAILCLGAAALGSSPLALVLVATRRGTVYPILRRVGVLAGVNSLAALLVFGLVYCFYPCGTPGRFSWTLFGRSAGLSVVASAALLLLFSLLLSLRPNRRELTLMLLALTVLGGGVAMALDFSPLLVNCAIGTGLVNLSRARDRIGVLLETLEKPFYLLLLLFLGIGWWPDDPRFFLAAGAWSLLRLAGKSTGGWAARMVAGGGDVKEPGRLWRLLAPAGALPMAMFYDLQFSQWGVALAPVVHLGVLGVLATDLVSPWLAARALSGETADAMVDVR